MLIDYGSTHNFINYRLTKLLNCFTYLAPKFHVTITNGGAINCLGKCHDIKLIMGECLLNRSMISIQVGGALGVQGFQLLGTMALNFQKLSISFSLEGKEFELRGIQ